MRFYRQATGDGLAQGDVLFPVPFIGYSLMSKAITDETGPRSIRLDQPEKGVITAPFESSWGILITQSCDLAVRDNASDLLTVARIYRLEDRVKVKAIKETVGTLKNPGRSPQYLYLPAHEEINLPKSIAYLLEVESFPRSDYATLRSLVRSRLTHEGLSVLQERLSYCYGRYAAEDDLYYSEQEWEEIKPKTSVKG